MNIKESSADTKERIRSCAIELFKNNGYENVTVVQICKAVGITKRTFYYHYESKEQLVSGITDYLGIKAEHFVDTLAAQQTNVGTLWALMSVYSINATDYGANIIRQIYINLVQGKNEGKFPQDMYLYKTVVKTINNAKLAGEISNAAAAEDIAFALYHGFRSVTITWASEGGEFDLVSAFRQIFITVLGVNDVNF